MIYVRHNTVYVNTKDWKKFEQTFSLNKIEFSICNKIKKLKKLINHFPLKIDGKSEIVSNIFCGSDFMC